MLRRFSAKPRLRTMFAFALLCLIALPGLASAQGGEPPVDIELVWSQSGVTPGGEIVLAAAFDVPDGHHITDKSYGLFFVDPELPDGFTIVSTEFPESDEETGEEVYRGLAAIQLTIGVPEDAQPGDYDIPVQIGWQLCRESVPEICYLPHRQMLEAKLMVLEPGATAIPSAHAVFGGSSDTAGSVGTGTGGSEGSVAAGATSPLEDRLTSALESGSLIAFLFVFVAGILISLTPCVYPMIPIIIGFVGSSAGGSRAKGFLLSVFFVLGLAITYSILGVIAGATGALFGAFMQNPIVLWAIVAVFVALGASMLGAFDITVPASIQAKLQTGNRGGVIGAILIGGVTGIIAAPCAGPPLLVLLSWIGNTGNVVLGFAFMATFALGLGVLFVVIGTFAGAVTALPQAGQWMETIKKGLGVVIMAVALYYINLLIPASWFTVLLGAFLLLTGLFMGAAKRWEELASGAAKWGKGIGVLLMLAGAFYFLVGLAQVNNISLASAGGSDAVMVAEEQHVPWVVDDHDGVLMQAMKEDRPVLVDFYADWCGVCVELEHKVWNQDVVIDAAKGYLPLKLDFTRATPGLEALRSRYGVGGLPTVMILGPDGVERARFTSYKSPEEVVAWLAKNL